MAISAMSEIIYDVDMQGARLIEWLQTNQDWIENRVQEQGALLLRGLKIHSSRQVAESLTTLFEDELLPYSHRSTPRTELKGNIYTATEYHSDQLIVQHNEQAYTNDWPMRIGFFCMLPSVTGGETPIADSRAIYAAIPKEIREEFQRKQLMYVRNFSEIDLPWQEVYGTESKGEVEQYCRANGIEFQWHGNDGLTTKQILPAVITHPLTGEVLWFNQAHLFHVSALEAEIREELMRSRGKEGLPRNTYFADGSDINDEYLALIRDLYQQLKIKIAWQKGDLLLLDNMLFSHGREPFDGERKVLVGMAKPYSNITTPKTKVSNQ